MSRRASPAAPDPAVEARSFLRALWPHGVPEGAHLLLWTLPDRASSYHVDLDAAATAAMALRADHDVYVGVGVGPAGDASTRIRSAEVVAIPGLVVDLDVEGPGHAQGDLYRQQRLFPDGDAALAFLDALPLQASIVVASGGGLQAWWLWREALEIASTADRERATRIAYGWSRFVRDVGAERGYHLDAVHDLARVMRLPGTCNLKTGTPRPVRILRDSSSARRYQPSDFEIWEQAPAAAVTTAASPDIGEIRLDPAAEPPFDMFQMLAQLEPMFALAWERKRSGFAKGSASEYDLSLATHAALAGWSPQQIADLLIAHRRKHGDGITSGKHKWPDYFARTIRKALAARAQRQAEEEVEEVLDAPTAAPHEETAELAPGDRAQLLELVRRATGVPIARLVVHGEAPPVYAVVLEAGPNVSIGGDDQVTSWPAWSKIAWRYGTIQPAPKKAEWQKVLRALQRLLEADLPEEAQEVEITRSWIREHLRASTSFTAATKKSEVAEYALTGNPFYVDEVAHWSAESLLRDLRIVHRQKITMAQLGRLLSLIGGSRCRIVGKVRGCTVTRHYWQLPVDRVEGSEP